MYKAYIPLDKYLNDTPASLFAYYLGKFADKYNMKYTYYKGNAKRNSNNKVYLETTAYHLLHLNGFGYEVEVVYNIEWFSKSNIPFGGGKAVTRYVLIGIKSYEVREI